MLVQGLSWCPCHQYDRSSSGHHSHSRCQCSTLFAVATSATTPTTVDPWLLKPVPTIRMNEDDDRDPHLGAKTGGGTNPGVDPAI